MNDKCQIGVIDWGWASAHMFDLDLKERAWLTVELEANRDWETFRSALLFHLSEHLDPSKHEPYLTALRLAETWEKKIISNS